MKDVTLQDLRRSTHLRSLILDYNFWHFSKIKEPKHSFQREYATEQDKKVAETQGRKQSQLTETLKLSAEVDEHNDELAREYAEGEEGVDYRYLKAGESAPDVVDGKKFTREVKQELRELRRREPELADYYDKFIFSNDTEVDKALDSEIPAD